MICFKLSIIHNSLWWLSMDLYVNIWTIFRAKVVFAKHHPPFFHAFVLKSAEWRPQIASLIVCRRLGFSYICNVCTIHKVSAAQPWLPTKTVGEQMSWNPTTSCIWLDLTWLATGLWQNARVEWSGVERSGMGWDGMGWVTMGLHSYIMSLK